MSSIVAVLLNGRGPDQTNKRAGRTFESLSCAEVLIVPCTVPTI